MTSIENLEKRVFFSVGTLDHSFGTAGQISTPASDTPPVMAVQKNGEFIVGQSTPDLNGDDHGTLERYRANGKLDPSFGVDGKVDLGAGQMFKVLSLTIGPDGKIVVVGANSNGSDLLARLTAKGKLDTHFGTAGITALPGDIIDTKVKVETNLSIVVGADLKISDDVVEDAFNATGELIHITRNGALDAGFGTNGIATNQIGSTDELVDFEAFGNGQIEALFYTFSQTSATFPAGLERFNADGTIDAMVNAGFNIDSQRDVRFLPDGSLLLVSHGINGALDVTDYSADGTPNMKFGTQGTATLARPADDTFFSDATVVETGYRLLVVESGSTGGSGSLSNTGGTPAQTPYLTLTGLTATGKVDHHFGKSGIVTVSPAENFSDVVTDGPHLLGLSFAGDTPAAGTIFAYKI